MRVYKSKFTSELKKIHDMVKWAGELWRKCCGGEIKHVVAASKSHGYTYPAYSCMHDDKLNGNQVGESGQSRCKRSGGDVQKEGVKIEHAWQDRSQTGLGGLMQEPNWFCWELINCMWLLFGLPTSCVITGIAFEHSKLPRLTIGS